MILTITFILCLSPTCSFKSWLLSKNPVSSNIQSLKKDLLSEISSSRKKSNTGSRAAILDAIRLLEAEGSGNARAVKTQDIEGLWSLVFSTQETQDRDKSDRLVDVISARLYKIFFKVAPFLAGGQEKVSRDYQISNRQNLDVQGGIVNNVVDIRLLPNLAIEINVDGTIRLVDNDVISTAKSLVLEVIFTSFSVCVYNDDRDKKKKLVLPLPKPKGSLDTTFCDGDLRISRGGRGGIFVAKKIKAT